MKYQEMLKCRECGKLHIIDAIKTPKYCKRCGNQILESISTNIFTNKTTIKYNPDDVVIAKRTIFGYKERKKMKKRSCVNCDFFSAKEVCCNPNSDYKADLVDKDFCCNNFKECKR